MPSEAEITMIQKAAMYDLIEILETNLDGTGCFLWLLRGPGLWFLFRSLDLHRLSLLGLGLLWGKAPAKGH